MNGHHIRHGDGKRGGDGALEGPARKGHLSLPCCERIARDVKIERKG